MFTVKTFFYTVMIKVLKVLLHVIPVNTPLLYTGQGSHLHLARLVGQTGSKSVLLVTDKGLTQIGLYKKLVDELNKMEIKVQVFDDITPDPTNEQINNGFSLISSGQCDAVIGFGGGSSMDAAKLISVLPTVNKPLDAIVGVLKIRKKGLPLFLIPTTAGTGSEVTIAAVFTDKTSGQKMPVADPVLVPMAAALDPDLMLGLPKQVTAATGFDALTHAVEAYISTNATKQTDFFAETATKLIWENLTTCVEDPKNIAARESMAIASTYAGLAFTKAGVGYAHGIAHQLGAFYHVPHGEANALTLPHVLKFSYPKCVGRLAHLAKHLGFEAGSEETMATAFVDAVFALQKSIGLAGTLPAIKEQDYNKIAHGALKESHGLYAVPRYMTDSQCIGILKAITPEQETTQI
jgi:alcohol dehydrogenase class IV